jgi:hypothetical protein
MSKARDLFNLFKKPSPEKQQILDQAQRRWESIVVRQDTKAQDQFWRGVQDKLKTVKTASSLLFEKLARLQMVKHASKFINVVPPEKLVGLVMKQDLGKAFLSPFVKGKPFRFRREVYRLRHDALKKSSHGGNDFAGTSSRPNTKAPLKVYLNSKTVDNFKHFGFSDGLGGLKLRGVIAHEAFHAKNPVLGRFELFAHAYGGYKNRRPGAPMTDRLVDATKQLGHAAQTRPGRVGLEAAVLATPPAAAYVIYNRQSNSQK